VSSCRHWRLLKEWRQLSVRSTYRRRNLFGCCWCLTRLRRPGCEQLIDHRYPCHCRQTTTTALRCYWQLNDCPSPTTRRHHTLYYVVQQLNHDSLLPIQVHRRGLWVLTPSTEHKQMFSELGIYLTVVSEFRDQSLPCESVLVSWRNSLTKYIVPPLISMNAFSLSGMEIWYWRFATGIDLPVPAVQTLRQKKP